MISTVILYKNEQEDLNRCINSLSWCKDIVVVHDSQDSHLNTLVQKSNIRVVKRLLSNDFSAQRNFGMEYAKNDWILFIDADEELSQELQAELESLNPDPQFSAYAISRIDIFWNQKMLHGEVGTAVNRGILRLVHKHKGTWQGVVHEIFSTSGTTARLNHSILHYPHQTVSEFIQDINYYSSLRAKEIAARPQGQLFIELLLYPPAKFFYTYFLKFGLLDGAAGFVYSFMMAFHSFLVRAKAITKTYDTL